MVVSMPVPRWFVRLFLAALVPAGSDELALDGRLASLGNYEHTDVVWESVALPTGG